MPRLTIDGRATSVPDGLTVIQAAERLGIYVARYCYHPGLSIAGNCRICLVEVEKIPKLQIACNTPVQEGMVVHTKSEKAEAGRRAVLEFLLANHPLDCPVCDQSGECDLQNFYMSFGLYDPRFREQKVKKKKAIRIGPHVMLDQERCILCSRCVRFTDEVTKTGEFGIFHRGDHAELGLYPGTSLDNPYSANVVDICPVGALTEAEFRFKARVWYLSSAQSVCNGCSQGCNVDLHFLLDRPHLNDGARIVRVKPRFNANVNQWWMCDEGRYGFGWVDRGRLVELRGGRGAAAEPEAAAARPAAPGARPAEEGAPAASPTWEQALSSIAGALRKPPSGRGDGRQPAARRIGVIASAQLTTEELYLIRRIFRDHLGAVVTANVPQRPGSSDDFLVKSDKNPNTTGATLLKLAGPEAPDAGKIVEDAATGRLEVMWVFGHDVPALFGESKAQDLASRVKLLVFSGTNENSTVPLAHWALPSAAYVEKDGTFVNCHGRVQRIGRAFPPLGKSREDWRFLLELSGLLGLKLDWKSPRDVFRALAADEAAFAGLGYDSIGDRGAPIAAARPTAKVVAP